MSPWLYILNFNDIWFSFSYVKCNLYSYLYSSFKNDVWNVYLSIHTAFVHCSLTMVFKLLGGSNLMQVFIRSFENSRLVWRARYLWASNHLSLNNIQKVWHGQKLYRDVGSICLIEKHGSNLQPLISEINSVDLSADETAL